MRNKFLLISFLFVATFFIGCDEDSPTEPEESANYVSISGDINDKFDAITFAGMQTEDSLSGFTVVLQPMDGLFASNYLTLAKLTDEMPAVGTYDIGIDVESGEDFLGVYFSNDSTFYVMYSGTVEITKSSSTNIAGKFDLKGSIFEYDAPNLNRIIDVKGQFSTIPMEF